MSRLACGLITPFIFLVLAASTSAAQTKSSAQGSDTSRPKSVSPGIIRLPAPPTTNASSEKAPSEKASADWWLVNLTGVLGFVGFLQLVVFGVQASQLRATVKAMERQEATAKDTAERQLRAYVNIDTGKLEGLASGAFPEAVVTVSNSGQTPAYNVTVVGGIALGASFPTLPSPVPPPVVTAATISPGASVAHVVRTPRALTTSDLTNLREGSRTLYVYGEIHYHDIYTKQRKTTYRLLIGGPVGTADGRLAVADEGNLAD